MTYDYCNSCDPCSKGCGDGCGKVRPWFNLQNDPWDSSYWLWEMGCDNGRVKLPTIPVACPKLSINYSNATLNLAQGECETQTLIGEQLGSIVNLDDLRDVDATSPKACSLLVSNPGCGLCPCSPDEMMWKKYTIPDATDVAEVDDQGFYKVLTKTKCGCIIESKVPIVPAGMTAINYVRDSVPDDPDFPWYYGQYNDTINLYLAQNAPQYFGKYALKVTVNYGIQSAKSDACQNVNFRSLVVPVVEGQAVNVEKEASILQGYSIAAATPQIPWGTQCLRSSFTFIVPKGKEAYLHHEFRLHSIASFSATNHYLANSTYDGKRVPDEIASQVNAFEWNASRLNALQVIVEPVSGTSNMNPVVDDQKSQLDPAVDEYAPL